MSSLYIKFKQNFMKKAITYLLVLFMLYSCQDDKYDLPGDKSPLFKNKEVVYFQNTMNNKLDTFNLNVKDYWAQTIERNYFRYIIVYYVKPSQKTTFLHFNISSHAEGYASFSILFSESDFNTGNNPVNFTINGITYNNVYKIQDQLVTVGDTIPNCVYFNYNYGIIRYEYKDGRAYNLIRK